MRNYQNEAYEKAFKTAKRIGITILCCIPVLIAFAYLTRKIITTNILQILCFAAIMGVTVLIVEFIARKREKQKQENTIDSKDVFK